MEGRRATALQEPDGRIQAKLDLKVLHRCFGCADFAVNNLELQDGNVWFPEGFLELAKSGRGITRWTRFRCRLGEFSYDVHSSLKELNQRRINRC